jgi:coatomer protein complex subunit gamma
VQRACACGRDGFADAASAQRWVNEVQEATRNSAKMVQYHALMLLYRIKQQDRLAVIKMVQAMARDPPRGHAAQCLLVRYVANVVASQQQPDKELFKYLLDCLHDKNFMVRARRRAARPPLVGALSADRVCAQVMYECARILCRLPNVSAVDITPAISVLQEFLTSPISVHRFAAVRTLSEIVQRYPLLVNSCSSDLEHLLGDSTFGDVVSSSRLSRAHCVRQAIVRSPRSQSPRYSRPGARRTSTRC